MARATSSLFSSEKIGRVQRAESVQQRCGLLWPSSCRVRRKGRVRLLVERASLREIEVRLRFCKPLSASASLLTHIIFTLKDSRHLVS